jgi:hypothetical protein
MCILAPAIAASLLDGRLRAEGSVIVSGPRSL